MIDINMIKADSMASNEALIQDYLKTHYPELDASPGTVINELLIKPAAALYAVHDAKLSSIVNQFSLSNIAQADNPDRGLAEALASNYKVFARTGSKGSGMLAVYTTSYANTYIYAGTIFTAGGIRVTALKTYIGVVADSVPASGESLVEYRLATPVSRGLYVFTVPVVTVDNTSVSVSAGQPAIMDNAPSYITKIEVASAITGGTDAETVKDLINRVLYGVTAAVPSGSAHIASLFSNIEGVNVFSQKAFGLGDAEMLRDRNNVTGISMGGRADIYCRTALLPSYIDIILTATRSSNTDSIWTANISRTAAPGFYYIKSITHMNTQQVLDGRDVTVVYRAAPEKGGPAVPDVLSARYSSYQAATIQFPFSGIADLSATFKVTVVAMPNLDVLQEYINNKAVRNEAQDVLVKAPVPNRIAVSLVCSIPPAVDFTDEATIKTVVAKAINSIEIGRGFLSAADIVKPIQDALPQVVVLFPIIINNTVYLPDGSVVNNVSNTGQLEAHSDEAKGVTHRNSAFICESNDVSLTIVRRATVS